MKNILKNSVQWACMAVVALLVVGCSEWTEAESLKLKQDDITKQDPPLYARYLTNLRTYKQSEHKVVYGWFNNVKTPFSQGSHLTTLPDSMDIVSLLNPDNLPDWIVREKELVREQKGTRCVYTISYSAIELQWKREQDEAKNRSETQTEVVVDPFLAFLGERLDASLLLCDKYDYDGVTFEYAGKSTLAMTTAEKELYTTRQNTFFDKIATWHTANASRMLILEGNPQYVLDKARLEVFKCIILPTRLMTSIEALAQTLIMAHTAGVPTERLLVAVQTPSFDPADPDTGYFNGIHAVERVAYWIATPMAGYSKAGLAVYNLQHDYFNVTKAYKYLREAIDIMNPSPKN